MTTYTITTAKNIDSLTGKAGGDTYNINGGTLTIDQDTRYGLNQTVSTSLGTITISSTLGGDVIVDSRYVRLIPFSSGSGNVPIDGTTISQGVITSKLIGVWSAINLDPITAGSAMPSSGFIKVKQVSQIPGFDVGALTGIGASATGEDIAGWLEIVGDEGKNITVPQLGSASFMGDWFEVGSVGADNTVEYQLPTSGKSLTAGTWFSGVFISKVDSPTQDSDYEFYPSMGTYVGIGIIGTDEMRGKVCWITSTGVLYLGKDLSSNTNGYMPPAGRKIVIPNIILINCTTASRTTNAIPNTTLGTRHTFSTGNGGNVSFDKVTSSWYVSLSTASSINLANSATNEQLFFINNSSEAYFTNFGVGLTAVQSQTALYCTGSTAGAIFTNCVFARYAQIVMSLIDVALFEFYNLKTFHLAENYYTIYSSRSSLLVDGWTMIGGYALLEYSSNSSYKNILYTANTGINGVRGSRIMYFSSANSNIVVEGANTYDANSYPSTSFFTISGYGSNNIDISNCGSLEHPLEGGGVTNTLMMSDGAWAKYYKIRRCYTNKITGYLHSGSGNTLSNIILQNVYAINGGIASYTLNNKNIQLRGVRVTAITSSSSGVVGASGSYWHDGFTSDTAGVLVIQMNAESEASAPYITKVGAKYTGIGSIYMPTIGMSITLESNYTVLGYIGFDSIEPNFLNYYTGEYQIDVGEGWSAWKILNATNLQSENSSMSYTLGFKLKVRLTTRVTNSSTSTGVTIYMRTTAEAQQTLYPLGIVSITFLGVVATSEIRIYDSVSNKLLAGVESCVEDPTLSWSADTVGTTRIVVINESYKIKEFEYDVVLGSQSIPIQMEEDIWYSNPL